MPKTVPLPTGWVVKKGLKMRFLTYFGILPALSAMPSLRDATCSKISVGVRQRNFHRLQIAH
ncbi:MAG: hypothetical protein V7L29_01230 [Nostoc sp.]|uniref:hypothetical protein n=1 Tax=Nostoc sp. TaxID=1180 RepID=UPI002FF325DD